MNYFLETLGKIFRALSIAESGDFEGAKSLLNRRVEETDAADAGETAKHPLQNPAKKEIL